MAFVLLLGSVHDLADAHQRRIPVVARLSSGPSGDPLQKAGYAAFQQGLHELSWLESQDVWLEPRWTVTTQVKHASSSPISSGEEPMGSSLMGV